ncbi:hypothetical protein CBR_g36542 [Chara braunii]|uniref:F-box domain-containing protein n=1 Tax=Chara braunii TaxID=69332 RepID=A0A388JZ58_CHABU|nr:hypothetical protein CBR_g36542 [Chara braunii]|eukprot:GBG63057.1 hypothetical protein CBR_g36542 [Chara braunii]
MEAGRSSGRVLPDEIWWLILRHGVNSAGFAAGELCALAMLNRQLRRILGDGEGNELWKFLFYKHWPKLRPSTRSQSGNAHSRDKSPQSSDWKGQYQIRFSLEKSERDAAHRRRVLRVQSQVAILQNQMRDYHRQRKVELARLDSATHEHLMLHRIRRAGVAAKVWEPQAVRQRHQALVEQSPVDVGARIEALRNEMAVCREAVERLTRCMNRKKLLLQAEEEELVALVSGGSPAKGVRKNLPLASPGAEKKAGRSAKLRQELAPRHCQWAESSAVGRVTIREGITYFDPEYRKKLL